jgi:hypothetical protein
MMQVKLIARIISASIISLVLGSSNVKNAQAQRAVPIINLTCVSPGINSGWWVNRKDVAIGREIYTTQMFMRQDKSETCRISATSTETLHLQFGIEDRADPTPLTVSVYLDGNEATSKMISAGQTREILLDVSRAKSFTIETTCSRANCGAGVWFYRAEIKPAVVSPGKR